MYCCYCYFTGWNNVTSEHRPLLQNTPGDLARGVHVPGSQTIQILHTSCVWLLVALNGLIITLNLDDVVSWDRPGDYIPLFSVSSVMAVPGPENVIGRLCCWS